MLENFQKYDNYWRMGQLNPTAPSVAPVMQPVVPRTAPVLIQQPAQPPPKKYEAPTPEKTFATAGILQLVAMGLKKLSEGAGYMFMREKEFTSAKNTVHIADRMLKKNGLNIAAEYISEANIRQVARNRRIPAEWLIPVARGQNAFYHDGLKLAVAPAAKPSLMLHELGHAVNAKNILTRGLQNSRSIAPYVPTALLLLNRLTPKKEGEKPNFVERNAGKLGFLAFLPTIIEEGVASIRGINAARAAQETLGKLNLKPLIRNYALAWSTYLLAGIGLGIAARYTFVENRIYKQNPFTLRREKNRNNAKLNKSHTSV